MGLFNRKSTVSKQLIKEFSTAEKVSILIKEFTQLIEEYVNPTMSGKFAYGSRIVFKGSVWFPQDPCLEIYESHDMFQEHIKFKLDYVGYNRINAPTNSMAKEAWEINIFESLDSIEMDKFKNLHCCYYDGNSRTWGEIIDEISVYKGIKASYNEHLQILSVIEAKTLEEKQESLAKISYPSALKKISKDEAYDKIIRKEAKRMYKQKK